MFQVFLILHYEPLVHQLAEVIFNKNLESLLSPMEGEVFSIDFLGLVCVYSLHLLTASFIKRL